MATKNYTDEFKLQIVNLVKNGRSYSSVGTEYGVAKSTVYTWVKNSDQSGSFKAKDNLSEDEKELIKLRKKLKQLEMENDILKQAALIIVYSDQQTPFARSFRSSITEGEIHPHGS